MWEKGCYVADWDCVFLVCDLSGIVWRAGGGGSWREQLKVAIRTKRKWRGTIGKLAEYQTVRIFEGSFQAEGRLDAGKNFLNRRLIRQQRVDCVLRSNVSPVHHHDHYTEAADGCLCCVNFI